MSPFARALSRNEPPNNFAESHEDEIRADVSFLISAEFRPCALAANAHEPSGRRVALG